MSDFKVIKVDRFYSKAVKDGFDDIVRQIFNNRVEGKEDFRYFDQRLLISTIAVLFSGFGCGYDYYDPYPNSKYVLATCSIMYFILTGLMQLYQWYVEKDIFLVFNEKVGRKDLKWEISSTIGKYDNIYKIEFKTINDQGAVQEYKAEKCCSTFMDVNGQVLVQFLEEWIMKCRSEVKPEKKSS
ncbi:unnamed protein product [Oikopleura dioica]|uniref:Signal peptidase complex subunit 2 n=1 Tax=Oikopleura dioica TaxID=34765 RepID=E4Y0I4_OIKDI|nr:unnamed protein product [Oikopleura dioica]CBY42112.1 unnamed protein product [Oikopleura dioica]